MSMLNPGEAVSEIHAHCPGCGGVLFERGVFCPWCAVQTKCKNCMAVLVQGAVACVECGSLVAEGKFASANVPFPSVQAQNVVRLEEIGRAHV